MYYQANECEDASDENLSLMLVLGIGLTKKLQL